MKNYFTFYYLDGFKNIRLLEVNENGRPSIAVTEQLLIDAIADGFDFHYKWSLENAQWERQEVPESVPLFEARPNGFWIGHARVDFLVHLYNEGKLGEKNLQITTDESTNKHFIKLSDAEEFWNRVLL